MEHATGFHELLDRARGGDRAGAEELLVLIRPWLEQLARHHARLNGPDGSVADLVQEAWLRVWQKLDQFEGVADEAQALAMFRAWLGRIVSRLGLNVQRDRNAVRRMPPGKIVRLEQCSAAPSGDSAAAFAPSAAEPTPSANAQAQEQERLVREALARLSDPCDRDIVRLRFFDGISLRQIAQRLGCSHEAVRQRYHVLLNQLQHDLKGLL